MITGPSAGSASQSGRRLQSCAGEDHPRRRQPGNAPSPRTVSRTSSATAVAAPTAMPPYPARSRCTQSARRGARDPSRLPVCVGDPAVHRDRELDRDERRGGVDESAAETGSCRRSADSPSRPGSTAMPMAPSRAAPPAATGSGSRAAKITRVDAGGSDCLDARRLLAVMGTRLERDVKRGAASHRPRLAQGDHLGVLLAELRVPPLTHDGAVAHHHRADQRIGMDATPTALREVQRAAPSRSRPRHGQMPSRNPRLPKKRVAPGSLPMNVVTRARGFPRCSSRLGDEVDAAHAQTGIDEPQRAPVGEMHRDRRLRRAGGGVGEVDHGVAAVIVPSCSRRRSSPVRVDLPIVTR